MFHEVGESGLADPFLHRSDAVTDADMDQRGRGIRLQQDGQPVAEHLAPAVDVDGRRERPALQTPGARLDQRIGRRGRRDCPHHSFPFSVSRKERGRP
ncbi:hypothetical protein GCM10022253_14240 [Sphingomonas endophytica]